MIAPQPAQPPLDPPPAHAGTIAAGWALLHEAGDAVAVLAQLGREEDAMAAHDFARRAAAAGPARLALAEQGIDDCAAALHIGLTALIAAADSGRDTTAAALTLWRELDHARCGLIVLTTPRD